MTDIQPLDQLATALALAQSDMQNATLNKMNPHFRSRYADLAAIRDAVVPVLAKHGLSVVQITDALPDGMVLRTRLMHTSGQYLDSIYPIAVDLTKQQAIGSALSYARRYSLAAIACIAAEEDDDGNAAEDAVKRPRPKPGNGGAAQQPETVDYIELKRGLEMIEDMTSLEAWVHNAREASTSGIITGGERERLLILYEQRRAFLENKVEDNADA